MKVRDLTPFDVFRQCDTQNTGGLCPPGLWGGLVWLGVEAEAEDILDLFESFDSDRDGRLSYREFLEMTRPPGCLQYLVCLRFLIIKLFF